MKQIALIEKYNPDKNYSVIYKNGESRDYYLKRFKIETLTIDRKFSLTQDIAYSKVVASTSQEGSFLQFNHITKKGDKKIKELDIDNFIGVKNWKAIGNKLIGYNKLSAFKILNASTTSNDEDETTENLELTLF